MNPKKPSKSQQQTLSKVIALMRSTADSLETTARVVPFAPSLPEYVERAAALRGMADTLQQIRDGSLPFSLDK